MTAEKYFELKKQIIDAGYEHEINWIANIKPCDNECYFVGETIWVILNSGMKEQIARMILERIQKAWQDGKPTSSAFGHKGKVAAIDHIKQNGTELFDKYCSSTLKLEYLQTLPFIGGITKYHLAKNLGIDCIKPDRHLVRIAKSFDLTPEGMCELIRDRTGEKLSMIDMVIWRAANLGMI